MECDIVVAEVETFKGYVADSAEGKTQGSSLVFRREKSKKREN
jgi:hypothetical protein